MINHVPFFKLSISSEWKKPSTGVVRTIVMRENVDNLIRTPVPIYPKMHLADQLKGIKRSKICTYSVYHILYMEE